MKTTMALLESALSYAARGWLVIPLEGKLPTTEHAYKDGSADPDQLRTWWAARPAANVGVVVGPQSGICVLDIDPRGGATEQLDRLQALNGKLPETLTVETGGGGHHLYFRYDPRARRRLVAPGVELKAEGGYVVAPPSIHPETGRAYQLAHDAPLAEMPAWLLVEAAQARPASPALPGGAIPAGERNRSLTSFAGAMRRKGAGESTILMALREENRLRCDPPLADSELEKIAGSVARYAPAAVPYSSSTSDDTQPARIVTEYEYADAGNANRLVELAGQDLRFSPSAGWLAWDGTRWRQDAEDVAQSRMISLARSLLLCASHDDSDRAKKLASHALKSLAEPRIRGALTLARNMAGIRIDAAELDRDPWLLNCRNGTLDMRTCELRPHRREDLLTRALPIDYDPDARCPQWTAFLEHVMDGNPALASFLMQAVGYSLTGSTREQRLFLLYGTGANGKTTFLETVSAVLGDYARQAPFEMFLVNDRGSATHDFARLRGARFVNAVEAEPGKRLAEAVVKHATGGDTVVARSLYHEHFEYRPQFKLWLACNHKPEIRSTGEAIWRRIWLVPFTVTIPTGQRDLDLPEKLRQELPGILAWAIRGCFAWRTGGMVVPPEVEAAVASYRDDMDWLAEFIAECCDVGLDLSTNASLLYSRYKTWAEARGEYCVSKRKLGLVLADAGFKPSKSDSTRIWRGLAPRDVGTQQAQGTLIPQTPHTRARRGFSEN